MKKKTSSNQPCRRDSEYVTGAFLKSFSIDPLNITFALFKGHSMLNVFKVSEYLWYT